MPMQGLILLAILLVVAVLGVMALSRRRAGSQLVDLPELPAPPPAGADQP